MSLLEVQILRGISDNYKGLPYIRSKGIVKNAYEQVVKL